jgi:hypothetical protein
VLGHGVNDQSLPCLSFGGILEAGGLSIEVRETEDGYSLVATYRPGDGEELKAELPLTLTG